MTFYTETKTELDSKNYVLYQYCPAGGTIKFKLKVDRPKACKKLGWETIGAEPYYRKKNINKR